MSPGERVDYEVVATRYRHGRALDREVLDCWHEVVAGYSAVPGVVVDLGAGTGVFSGAWREWGATQVVAIEPSDAMRGQARAAGLPPQVRLVAGRAERLPLRRGTVDVIWLSTVVHHLADLDEAIAEMRRVLRPGGTVLVRGLFADRGDVGWLRVFADDAVRRARARFPATGDVVAAFDRHGIGLADVADVAEPAAGRSSADAAAWIESMHGADTLLNAFTDAEVAGAVGELRDQGSALLDPATLVLLAFTRR